MPTFEEEEGYPIAAKETNRRDLISRFVYRCWLLKEAQSPCCPKNSTGMPAFEAAEAESIRSD
jgi:hypothetical protein